MRRTLGHGAATLLAALATASLAHAAPISLGGFTFAAGEAAFADSASLVSGSGVRFNCTAGGIAASSYTEALAGSDITQCVNVDGGGTGVIEIQFSNNLILNGPGADLVIFEVSGPQPAGTPDPRERFEASVFDGLTFSAFVALDPVATGFDTPDPTLDVFAVPIDLSTFGIGAAATVGRIRLHLFDNGQGTKGADIAAVGALNSLPEPSTILLELLGVLLISVLRRTSTAT